MKPLAVVTMFGLLTAVVGVGRGHAQIPAQGLSQLICVLEVEGSGTYSAPGNSQLSLVVADNGADPPGTVGTADVTISHGATGSSHTVTYEDTHADGILDCGDTVVNVTP